MNHEEAKKLREEAVSRVHKTGLSDALAWLINEDLHNRIVNNGSPITGFHNDLPIDFALSFSLGFDHYEFFLFGRSENEEGKNEGMFELFVNNRPVLKTPYQLIDGQSEGPTRDLEWRPNEVISVKLGDWVTSFVTNISQQRGIHSDESDVDRTEDNFILEDTDTSITSDIPETNNATDKTESLEFGSIPQKNPSVWLYIFAWWVWGILSNVISIPLVLVSEGFFESADGINDVIIILCGSAVVEVAAVLLAFYVNYFVLFNSLNVSKVLPWLYVLGSLGFAGGVASGLAEIRAIGDASIEQQLLAPAITTYVISWILGLMVIRLIVRRRYHPELANHHKIEPTFEEQK